MEKSVLKKQYKIFGRVALALVVLLAVMMSAGSVHNDSGSKLGRLYPSRNGNKKKGLEKFEEISEIYHGKL